VGVVAFEGVAGESLFPDGRGEASPPGDGDAWGIGGGEEEKREEED